MIKRVKKVITSVLIGAVMIAPCTSISAKTFEADAVYLSNAKEKQCSFGGVTVHEYTWSDGNINDISVMSELDDAQWKTTKKDNGYTIKHRAAKEYETINGHYVWNGAAESRSYNKNGKLGGYIKTTVKVVNSYFPSSVYETATSGWQTGKSYAKTKTGFLANESGFAMRSYWSTEK